MTDHRDTDERLRSRLNSDQPGRERMCLAILSLDRQYSAVTPRRPEGGPDGGRDIEAIFRGETRCLGGIGFQNSVDDSAKNKREATKKFHDDLRSALQAEPGLRSFVFFTNVDLTPAEIEKLQDAAFKKGVTHVDIFWRERIRQVLDSPEGLGLRYQYLKLSLSEAEQAAFFARFGGQLEQLIINQQRSIESRLDRIEFFSSSVLPFNHVSVSFSLGDKPIPIQEDMAVLISISGIRPRRDSLFLYCRSESPVKTVGKAWMWSDPSKHVGSGQTHHPEQVKFFSNSWSVNLFDASVGPFALKDIAGCVVDIFVTRPLLEASLDYRFMLNNYVAHDGVPRTSSESPVTRSWWKDGVPSSVLEHQWYPLMLVGGSTFSSASPLRRHEPKIIRVDDSSASPTITIS